MSVHPRRREPEPTTRKDDAPRPSAAEREAGVAAFVEEMQVAARASVDARSHADRIESLRRFVVATSSSRRMHVVSLMSAALEAEARERSSVGLPPWEDRMSHGRIEPRSTGADAPQRAGDVPGWEAVTTLDVDDAVLRSIEIVRELLAVPKASGDAKRLWDRLERTAFAPCFETSTSCLGGRDRRRTLLILWLALRRSRPAAAAVLRACLSLDRAWRAGLARAP